MPHINKQMISFFLTTKCNLGCRYCYNYETRGCKEEKTLSFDIAKAGIDYFFDSTNHRHIRFYGPGEPTQELSLMKKITEYAKSKADGTSIVNEIQTNGAFGHDVRSWLAENMNIIWVSFDGEPDVHDANRPFPNGVGSSSIIEDNVKWLIANKGTQDLMIGARVTITDKNIDRQKGLVDYFLSLGIRHIWTDPLFSIVGTVPACKQQENRFDFDMDKYVENYLDAHNYGKTLGIEYHSFLTCNFDGDVNRHCRTCTPTPHLTPDGYVSACDMVTFGESANHMDCFVYGKWDDASKSFIFDDEKIALLQGRCVENMAHCKDCNARHQCGGYCLGEVVNEVGDMYGQIPWVCVAIRKLHKAINPPVNLYDYPHP